MANTVDKVIKIALAEVGYLEKSKSAYLANPNIIYEKVLGAGEDNYTKYGKEMHDIYPQVMDFPAYWCDAFVDWCFYKAYGIANAKGLLGGNFDDYTVNSAKLYKNKNAYYKTPMIGDQVFFKNTQRINHTGFVYAVDANYFYTVEGNTSSSAGVVRNGGCVATKKYKLGYAKVDGFGRPRYDVVLSNGTITTNATTPTSSKYPTIKYGDKNDYVKAWQNYLNSCGFNCGQADGDFGSKTLAALKKWQKVKKLPVDGIVNEADWLMIGK